MLTKPNNAKKSASTIGKSLTGPTLMVLKGLGRMSWLYYDTCKLLDVLIFSEQDDKRLKKKWTVQCSVVKVLFKGGVSRIRGYQYVIFLIVVENPVISVILWTMTPYVKIKTQSLIFFNKRNKLEIEVTIGVKWTFQAVAKIG